MSHETSPPSPGVDRRAFLRQSLNAPLALLVFGQAGPPAAPQKPEEAKKTGAPAETAPAPQPALPPDYKPSEHDYAMGVDPGRCIGCGRCVEACKTENDVPREPFYFRTWVERYSVLTSGETVVTSVNGGVGGVSSAQETGLLRTFFVPKLCNQCANPPCVQVCPVGATFKTQDGVVLVDKDYCLGCRYCIQGCPYGARYLDPVTHTAEKCTFCYHRLVKGLVPVCVEVCPTQARIFGEAKLRTSPLSRFLRQNRIQVLKPHLNTEPKVYYANLDGEVR